MDSQAEIARLVEVVAILRRRCPWDARQTHRSLVQYLIEETGETVEAIENGDPIELREELGDLLYQVVFHADLSAAEPDGFDLGALAAGIADKLVARHPHVFAAAELPDDLDFTWEQRKAVEKGRRSALDGIPDQLSSLARAHKVVSRMRSRRVAVELPAEPIDADRTGRALLEIVARAQAWGVDPDQAMRDAVRKLEAGIRAAEANALDPAQPGARLEPGARGPADTKA